MKRVIEIDEKTYDKALHPKDYDMSVGEMYDVLEDVLNAVFNGTPLNDVLDKIINKIFSLAKFTLKGVTTQFVNSNDVVNIINEYKESEDKA